MYAPSRRASSSAWRIELARGHVGPGRVVDGELVLDELLLDVCELDVQGADGLCLYRLGSGVVCRRRGCSQGSVISEHRTKRQDNRPYAAGQVALSTAGYTRAGPR
jgi:hypothetical protein